MKASCDGLKFHADGLPEVLDPSAPEGRSEQHAVYAVLDAMVTSAFDPLNEVELTLDDLAVMSSDLRAGRLRMATLRAISSQLANMRRRAGPSGDSSSGSRGDRAAPRSGLGRRASYWLTVVATVFLPLTFVTGFFGMNFAWMVHEIDTELAFWLLGIGTLLLGVALIWGLVVRGSPVQAEPEHRHR